MNLPRTNPDDLASDPGITLFLPPYTLAELRAAGELADDILLPPLDDAGTFAADEIDFDVPAPPDQTPPPACHCDACLADLTVSADPWAEEVEARPYCPIDGTPTASYGVLDAAWECGYVVGHAMLPARVPGGLSGPETIAWCEGNERGWRDGLADELARLDRIEAEEEAEAAMADRYASRWDGPDGEVLEARQGSGHGYGPDSEDEPSYDDPSIAGGL